MANGFWGWSASNASDNGTADTSGGINVPEGGTSPSAVNNGIRGLMQRLAQFFAGIGYPTAGGTANALTLTPGNALTSYASNMVFTFKAASSNTGAATLNISAVGAKAIRKISGGTDVALSAGDIAQGARYTVVYDSTANSSAGGFILTAGLPTFSDSAFRIQDNSDSTKQIAFEASGITTGFTRTATMPNASGTLALTNIDNSFSANQTISKSTPRIDLVTGAADEDATLRIFRDTALRWSMWKTNAAETGANAGSNFNFRAYDDSGASLGDVYAVTRATKQMSFGGNVTPITNDGVSLGVSGTAWSDLFLATGGVVNWGAGNATLTHGSGALTFQSATPSISLTDSDTGAVSQWSANSAAGSAFFHADLNNVVANSSLQFGVDGAIVAVVASDSIRPLSDDQIPLGKSGTAWSDLFLASGGVINWNASAITLTHSGSSLVARNPQSTATATDNMLFTVASTNRNATLAIDNSGGSNNSALDFRAAGVSAATLTYASSTDALAFAGASGGYSFDGDVSLGTSNALTAGSINVGHASDTTLSRSAAGVLAVEGNVVPSPASQASGDILYRGASSWSRLAKGTARQVLRMNSGATAPEWADGATLGTPQSPSGVSSVDFTSIPSGTQQIVIAISGVSGSGTGALQLQLGDSGGIEATGYSQNRYDVTSAAVAVDTSTSTAFPITGTFSASTAAVNAVIRLTLLDSATFTWAVDGTAIILGGAMSVLTGIKSTSAELDRVRLLLASGTFDAGKINIQYQ